jgi:conjugal transfer/entry exclusion protein
MDDQRNHSQPSDLGATSDEPTVTRSGSSTTEPVLRQLDTIIENVTSYATPVLREIAARAADLAAKAGQAAGPMAQKAADRTGEVGDLVATRSRAFASDLRSDTETRSAAAASDDRPSDGLPPTP